MQRKYRSVIAAATLRHCEQPISIIASVAKQSRNSVFLTGLLWACGPRNDGSGAVIPVSIVIPAQAGIQTRSRVDSRFRGNDVLRCGNDVLRCGNDVLRCGNDEEDACNDGD